MTLMSKPQTTIYSGTRVEEAGPGDVRVDGRPLSPAPSQRVANHSPDGFNWGYGGSGPAQLALGILLDYYGKGAPEVRFYQDFKFRVVAALPQGAAWTMTGAQIESAMREIVAERETRSA